MKHIIYLICRSSVFNRSEILVLPEKLNINWIIKKSAIIKKSKRKALVISGIIISAIPVFVSQVCVMILIWYEGLLNCVHACFSSRCLEASLDLQQRTCCIGCAQTRDRGMFEEIQRQAQTQGCNSDHHDCHPKLFYPIQHGQERSCRR